MSLTRLKFKDMSVEDLFSEYISTPRLLTIKKKEIIDEVSMLDSSGANAKSYCSVSSEDLLKLRKKAYVNFYTDPRQITRILSSIRSGTETWMLAKNFLKIFTKY